MKKGISIIATFFFSSYLFSQAQVNCLSNNDNSILLAGHKSGDSIPGKFLYKINKISAGLKDHKIVSFLFSIHGDAINCSGDMSIKNTGMEFNSSIRKILQKARPGHFISIECIVANDPLGNLVVLQPAYFIVALPLRESRDTIY